MPAGTKKHPCCSAVIIIMKQLDSRPANVLNPLLHAYFVFFMAKVAHVSTAFQPYITQIPVNTFHGQTSLYKQVKKHFSCLNFYMTVVFRVLISIFFCHFVKMTGQMFFY